MRCNAPDTAANLYYNNQLPFEVSFYGKKHPPCAHNTSPELCVPGVQKSSGTNTQVRQSVRKRL